jgi:hypothetical protein
MFTGAAFLRPGQELRDFEVLRDGTKKTDAGRVLASGEGTRIGTIKAVLAAAKPEEKERWRQLQHPITHKIIQQRAPTFEVLPGDAFVRAGRRFFVQAAPYNVGDLNHWTIYYCEERSDTQ